MEAYAGINTQKISLGYKSTNDAPNRESCVYTLDHRFIDIESFSWRLAKLVMAHKLRATSRPLNICM